MRVLIASSRDWPQPARVHDALQECANALQPGQRLTVVHGHSRKGADASADTWAWWAHRFHLPVDKPERWPAAWSAPCRSTCPARPHRRDDPRGHTVCPMAGYYRNEEMVAAGADLCMAFMVPGDRAPEQLVRVARAAGIDVIEFTPLAEPDGASR
ncbi:SLOG family protein [Micromonospora aurantiaca]|uniref:SLOG family protein n=1 Tax=Micromonospora aurantiaca (nom. illeg.) TaxID=47850 RepID=UPI003442B5E6